MIDLLIYNAIIRTNDPARPIASAIAIQRDRIVALGGVQLEGIASANTKRLDAGGAAILPAFCDAHIHWAWTARNMSQIDLFDVPSRAEAVERVGRAASRAEGGKWLVGFGWAQGMWRDAAFPTAADLDAVSPNNPVVLSARSGHASWCNSLALNLAGIGDSTENPKGGEIQRDAQGRATGILFEEAMSLVSRQVPKATTEEIAAAVEAAQPHAWRAGIGAMHDFDWQDAFAAYDLMRQRGTLGIRMLKQINDPEIPAAYAAGFRSGFGDDWLRIGALKIFADGALGSVTAQMIEPYNGQPTNRGIVVTPKARIMELVLEATRRGFHSTVHAIGDEAVRHVLDVFESARALENSLGIPRDARRHRIEHVQVIHPDDARRLAELGIIASIQPIHATADYQAADRLWGDRARLGYNARVQLDYGARVAFGSDSPVEPFAPLGGIHAAVTRRRADGSPGPDGWYPEARLTVDEAIRGFTEGPAWAAGMEDRLGRLAPGYLADLVMLDADLHAIVPHSILGVNVLGTMVGGDWKFRA